MRLVKRGEYYYMRLRRGRIGTGIIAVLLVVGAVMVLTGCASTTKALTKSAGGKNVNISGYAMVGELEMANAETATPQGKLIIGNVDYKSRRVSIPATDKVPNAAAYKHVKRVTLFGTSETTTEWDYTAASPDEAEVVRAALAAQAEKDAQADKESDSGGAGGGETSSADANPAGGAIADSGGATATLTVNDKTITAQPAGGGSLSAELDDQGNAVVNGVRQ